MGGAHRRVFEHVGDLRGAGCRPQARSAELVGAYCSQYFSIMLTPIKSFAALLPIIYREGGYEYKVRRMRALRPG